MDNIRSHVKTLIDLILSQFATAIDYQEDRKDVLYFPLRCHLKLAGLSRMSFETVGIVQFCSLFETRHCYFCTGSACLRTEILDFILGLQQD